MTASKDSYIARATAYFADVDRFDTEAILSHLTDDVILEVPTDGVRKVGIDEVRRTYLNRDKAVKESWHGDFEFTCDDAAHRLAVRLAVKRTTATDEYQVMDNLTLLTFDGDRIARITVWMSGENSLT